MIKIFGFCHSASDSDYLEVLVWDFLLPEYGFFWTGFFGASLVVAFFSEAGAGDAGVGFLFLRHRRYIRIGSACWLAGFRIPIPFLRASDG